MFPTRRSPGWTTAKLLLDVYGHFLPTEYTGYADALSQPSNAPYAHPEPPVPAGAGDDSAASPTSGTGFRLPAVGDAPQIPDHARRSSSTCDAGTDRQYPEVVLESALQSPGLSRWWEIAVVAQCGLFTYISPVILLNIPEGTRPWHPVLYQKSADPKRGRFRRSRGGHGRGLSPTSGIRTGVRCGR